MGDNEVPNMRAALPASTLLSREEMNWVTNVIGRSKNYFVAHNWNVGSAANIRDFDVETDNKVVLLGQSVVQQLFGNSSDPIGRVVRLRAVPFTAIGVMTVKGRWPRGQDSDDKAFVPRTSGFDWPFADLPDIIAIKAPFGKALGIALGSYPALKASLLASIDALRPR